MTTGADEVRDALMPVTAALETLGVAYYVGGSMASSVHGLPRTSIDVDLVAALREADVSDFARRLSTDYYLDEGRIRDAVHRRRSFNLIHLASMFKIDVFVAKERAFDGEALRRARPGPLPGASGATFRLASPEDIVLAKLEWFRAGGETSERQWNDVLGLLRVQGERLDADYLRRFAAALGVADLLERAQGEG
jgi:hypothetical protein